jgi:hypothetical protein
VLHRPGKNGLGTAYIEGFKYGLEHRYDLLLEMDADLSHDPAAIPSLLRATSFADVVLGSRYVRGGGVEDWGFSRQLISRGGSFYARKVLGLSVKDLTGGFKCFRREVLESLDLSAVRSNGYCFQIEMTYRAHQKGFKIVEVPITFRNRVVMPPMVRMRPHMPAEVVDSGGDVTEPVLAHYLRRAAAGTALIIVEATAVDPAGRPWAHGLHLDADEYIAGLARLAGTIRAEGAIAGIQLVHGGPQASPRICSNRLVGPMAEPVAEGAPMAHALTAEEIREIEASLEDVFVMLTRQHIQQQNSATQGGGGKA